MLSLYIVGGAYAFIYLESELEEEERQEKLELEQRLNDSENYMAEYFTALHYNPAHRLDNCTHQYTETGSPANYSDLHSACPASQFYTSLCSCIRAVRDLYQQEVGASMEKLVLFLVRMAEEHGFDGDVGEFEPKWTVSLSFLDS